jgi:hypothetical protein
MQRGREADWTREALRLHRRYEREIVDALGLCPWARRARATGAVAERVFLQDNPADLGPSLAALEELTEDGRIELVFFIYPCVGLGRRAFEDFATEVRNAEAARHVVGEVPFVSAVFHPDAAADTADAERLIPFLRRTPDPTIQLLRARVLERVRGSVPQGKQFVDPGVIDLLVDEPPRPSLRDQVARANLETVRRLGLAALHQQLDDIRHDRDRTYEALGRAPSPS